MSTFAGYQVLGRVAAGSTGVVWKAFDPLLERPVAIKELHPSLAAKAASRAQLREEARVLASLDDEHVVTVYDFVEDAERAWIVEEWVEGASLDRVISAHGRLSGEQACGVLRGALLGLAHAHDRGLVHGDVKPGNILVDRRGVAKLVDFGLASPAGERGGSGTPAYISPEAATGDPVDTRSDVYSSAAVLFHLLAGHPVYTGPDPFVLDQHVTAPVPRLPGPEGRLAAVLARALSKNPDDRPRDGRALLRELEEATEDRYGVGWTGRAGLATIVIALVPESTDASPRPQGPSTPMPAPSLVTSGDLDTDLEAATRSAPRAGVARRVPRSLLIGGLAAAVVAAGIGIAGAALSGGGHAEPLAASPDATSDANAAGVPGTLPAPGTWEITTTLTSVGAAIPGPFMVPPPPLGSVSKAFVECNSKGCQQLRYEGEYGYFGLTAGGPVGFAAVSSPATYEPCTADHGPSYDGAKQSVVQRISETEYRGTLTLVGFRHAPCRSGKTTYTFGDPSLVFSQVALLTRPADATSVG